MEILGVGMSELIFVLIIALLVLGPRDMEKAGKTIGKWLRNIITSDGWKMFQQTSREIRTLPNKLMREANEELNQINKDINKDVNNASPSNVNWGAALKTPPRSKPVSTDSAENNKIAPPEQKDTESDSQDNA